MSWASFESERLDWGQVGRLPGIHGQVSWDIYFTELDEPDGQTHMARVGPEAVVGVPIKVTRVIPT